MMGKKTTLVRVSKDTKKEFKELKRAMKQKQAQFGVQGHFSQNDLVIMLLEAYKTLDEEQRKNLRARAIIRNIKFDESLLRTAKAYGTARVLSVIKEENSNKGTQHNETTKADTKNDAVIDNNLLKKTLTTTQ